MKKYLIITPLAAIISLLLFGFMASITQNNTPAIPLNIDSPVVDIFSKPEPSKITPKENKLPEPPKIVQPKISTTVAPDNGGDGAVNLLTEPDLTTTQFGDNFSNNFTIDDGNAVPIIQVMPNYPIQAARDGKEGWVLLSFSINEIGAVFNVQVVDSVPKSLFDNEAKKALKKWKYRAKTVNGKTTAQHNMVVQLDFKMDK